jgi:pimeloyl-ACP methyl ester carboxylesterase
MRSRLTPLLLCGLLASPGLGAELVTPYGYPLVDPLEATVIGTPEIFGAELPEDIPFEERDVLVFRGRDVPDIFWYTRALRYALSAQPGRAPLVFILPGTGANFNARKSLILQRALYQAGFHVVSLPSPLHPNFIVSASASRRPGLLAEDANDIYRVMALIRRQVRDEIEIAGWHLVGYSLGATYAAFVARLDDERRSFGFERVLMINPPVDLANSARILDALFDEHIPTLADFDALFNQLMQVLSEFYSPTEQMLFSEDLVFQIYQRRPPPDRTLEALIGAAFRLSSIDLVFTSDVMTNAGLLVMPGHRPSLLESLTPYFKAASRLSFEDYARAIVYPYYLERAPATTFEQLSELNSLRAIESYLRDTHKIGLMHNADDILLSPDEIEYLQDVFGDRAVIFPHGGHAGNLAYRDNLAYIVDFFAD